MQLIDYMRGNALDDAAFAAIFNEGLSSDKQCTEFAVKKWKYRERVPDAERIIRIEDITKGSVTLRDWITESETVDRNETSENLRSGRG